MNQLTETIIRYSPKPIEAYTAKVHGIVVGPSTSSMLRTEAAWNLAWLSHDYTKALDHSDPTFTVMVNQTSRWFMSGKGFDTLDNRMSDTLGHQLVNLPAPRFVFVMKNHRVLTTVPLYKKFGAAWLDTMEQRSHLCTTQDPDNAVEVPEISSAVVVYLDALRKKGAPSGS